jgi:hypothetical protein
MHKKTCWIMCDDNSLTSRAHLVTILNQALAILDDDINLLPENNTFFTPPLHCHYWMDIPNQDRSRIMTTATPSLLHLLDPWHVASTSGNDLMGNQKS